MHIPCSCGALPGFLPLLTCVCCYSRQISDVPNPGKLYSDLMDIIVRFGQAGLIHGDYNEFNILIRRETGEPVIIDFPQMVSTSHENAEWCVWLLLLLQLRGDLIRLSVSGTLIVMWSVSGRFLGGDSVMKARCIRNLGRRLKNLESKVSGWM